MPKWIHDRAEHLLAKNPNMPKSMAFAVATQQSHSLGKSPKGYGTDEGRSTAKAKYDTPKDDKKTANPGGLSSKKMAHVHLHLVKQAGEAPTLPRGHKAGTVVPKGGSKCANCTYAEVREDGPHCTSPEYQAWAGTSELIDADVDENGAIIKVHGRITDATAYCSDWWEENKKQAAMPPDQGPVAAEEQAEKEASLFGRVREHVGSELDTAAEKGRGYLAHRAYKTLPTDIQTLLPPALRDKLASRAGEAFLSMIGHIGAGVKEAGIVSMLKNPSIREHGTELAGLGVLTVPGLDTMQSRIRARMAGDKTHDGAEKRRFLGEFGHAAADVGGLGILMAPEIGKLLKHGFAPTGFGGNQAQNPPGMRQRSQIPPFVAPPIEVKAAGVGVGAGMTASSYSGPLSYGSFKMTSGIPPFRSPAMAQADSSGEPKPWMVGENKTAGSMNTATGAMSPTGRLNVTQRVGAPKVTGVSGPSIADIAKPKGFGTPISGAKKNQL